MLRLTTTASLLLSTLAIAAIITQTNGDNAPISLDDIEEAKSARLMKNKEDIDVQSTFHEDDIKGTVRERERERESGGTIISFANTLFCI
mmetsp:Transcript_3852/g.7323  ORF Transcript_3852/g.7323 Transcript_3852/m.7323 type:complete len:90 (+) Transcript_3852:165-434(+)